VALSRDELAMLGTIEMMTAWLTSGDGKELVGQTLSRQIAAASEAAPDGEENAAASQAVIEVIMGIGGQPLGKFVQSKTYFRPKSARPPDHIGAVLVIHPTLKCLEFASRVARHSALCVMEHPSDPLHA
jgi:hypothetical protein